MLPTKFQVNWLLGLEKKRKKDFQDGHHGSHLGFPISMILATFDLPSLESIGLLAQEKKRKIDFQDGRHDGHLRFPIGTILATFDLQVTLMLPTKFRVNWHLGLGEEAENRFSRLPHGGHLGFTIGMILAIFDLQVTWMLPSKFGVNWPFGSGEDAKNRFSRWLPWRPS